jgi:hypothetical protein
LVFRGKVESEPDLWNNPAKDDSSTNLDRDKEPEILVEITKKM